MINDAGGGGNGRTGKSRDARTGPNGKTGSDPLDPLVESDAKAWESTTPGSVEARGRTCVTRDAERFLTLWCTKMGFVIGKCEL